MGPVVSFELNVAKPKMGYNANVERGVFNVLRDLINLDNNIAWDPVGAFFSLSGGYSVYMYNNEIGAVYDPYGEELFLTNAHIQKLFALARAKKLARAR